ncbi:hypothetical protein CRENBAI_007815 [Crenichthys baileyi]|uniref:Uncharacterized protein n=1 Tax=Crenichthys baileyi TaxID=28760 RepID=A0AAV9QW40_9TELE
MAAPKSTWTWLQKVAATRHKASPGPAILPAKAQEEQPPSQSGTQRSTEPPNYAPPTYCQPCSLSQEKGQQDCPAPSRGYPPEPPTHCAGTSSPQQWRDQASTHTSQHTHQLSADQSQGPPPPEIHKDTMRSPQRKPGTVKRVKPTVGSPGLRDPLDQPSPQAPRRQHQVLPASRSVLSIRTYPNPTASLPAQDCILAHPWPHSPVHQAQPLQLLGH